MYQKCPFKTFYGLYNILKVSKTSKLQPQTRPTFTAIALRRSRCKRLCVRHMVPGPVHSEDRIGTGPFCSRPRWARPDAVLTFTQLDKEVPGEGGGGYLTAGVEGVGVG